MLQGDSGDTGSCKMSLAAANHEIIRLVKDGVKVTFKNSDGDDVADTVKVVDWSRLKAINGIMVFSSRVPD